MSNILSFSVGKKLLMSLAGLFLVSFLAVHLGINLLLLLEGKEMAFNKAANFMATNQVIKVMEIVLFGGFLLHMILGAIVSIQNLIARPVRYKVKNNSQLSYFSKYMLHTAIIVTIFLGLHLFDFYVKIKFIEGGVQDVIYDGKHYHDLASLVIQRFQIWWVVVFYIIALFGLAFHLHHGFQSAFQTLGLNHPVYTPIIKGIGILYTVLVSLGFMAIPIAIYIKYVVLT